MQSGIRFCLSDANVSQLVHHSTGHRTSVHVRLRPVPCSATDLGKAALSRVNMPRIIASLRYIDAGKQGDGKVGLM